MSRGNRAAFAEGLAEPASKLTFQSGIASLQPPAAEVPKLGIKTLLSLLEDGPVTRSRVSGPFHGMVALRDNRPKQSI